MVAFEGSREEWGYVALLELINMALVVCVLCVVGEPQFIADSCGQQLRKLVLELIHRLPTNDHLKGHVKVHWCERERREGEVCDHM